MRTDTQSFDTHRDPFSENIKEGGNISYKNVLEDKHSAPAS